MDEKENSFDVLICPKICSFTRLNFYSEPFRTKTAFIITLQDFTKICSTQI